MDGNTNNNNNMDVLKPSTSVMTSYNSDHQDFVRAETILNGVSLGLLVLACLLWSAVWGRSRIGHPYRYSTFLVTFVSATSCHVTGLATHLVETPTGVACRSVVVINAFASLVLYTFLLMYAVFCVAVAMRRLSSGPRFYFILLVTTAVPLLLVGMETTLDLVFHPDTPCLFFHLSNTYHWFTRAPKTILILGSFCVVMVLFYWLFCFDNQMFKRNRDFLLIRHGSVTLLLLVVYCLFMEIYKLVYIDMRTNKSFPRNIVRYGDEMRVVEASRGIFVAAFLCFFDLEILTILFPGCPCLPDINDTDLDEAWESRIRSESFVRFSSDKEDQDATCSDGSELRPQGKVTYGTLVEDAEEMNG